MQIDRGKDQKPILETFQENIDNIESLLSFIYILLSHKTFDRYVLWFKVILMDRLHANSCHTVILEYFNIKE